VRKSEAYTSSVLTEIAKETKSFLDTGWESVENLGREYCFNMMAAQSASV
jgi:hypothetical protein